MNVQNPRRSCKVPGPQKPGITSAPKRLEIFMCDGSGRLPFPGWMSVLCFAEREHVAIRRDGDRVRIFEVGPYLGFEFWGHA